MATFQQAVDWKLAYIRDMLRYLQQEKTAAEARGDTPWASSLGGRIKALQHEQGLLKPPGGAAPNKRDQQTVLIANLAHRLETLMNVRGVLVTGSTIVTTNDEIESVKALLTAALAG